MRSRRRARGMRRHRQPQHRGLHPLTGASRRSRHGSRADETGFVSVPLARRPPSRNVLSAAQAGGRDASLRRRSRRPPSRHGYMGALTLHGLVANGVRPEHLIPFDEERPPNPALIPTFGRTTSSSGRSTLGTNCFPPDLDFGAVDHEPAGAVTRSVRHREALARPSEFAAGEHRACPSYRQTVDETLSC